MSDWESDAGDGGAPPGGTVEQQPCDCACEACAEDYSMSNPCAYQLGHGTAHQCSYGHQWYQDGPYGTIQRERCGAGCDTDGCNGSCVKDRVHSLPHWCGRHEWN